MIAWLLNVFRSKPEPVEVTPDATEVRHKATLLRADRLLARVKDYRAADVRRQGRHE